MQKHVFYIEKLRKITLYAILLLALLLTSLILLLQTAYIQTKITQFITKKLSEKFNTEIQIDNVKLSLFKGFVFKGINIKDQQKDTLLYIREISVVPDGIQINFNDIALKKIRIDRLYLNVYEISKDTLNLQFVLNALKSDNEDDNSSNFSFKSKSIQINNSCFAYRVIDSTINVGFNYKDIRLDSIILNFEDVGIENNTIKTKINTISFSDKSGLRINTLKSEKLTINPNYIKLKKFNITTPDSKLTFDSVNINYPAEYDFSEFISKGAIKASINKSSIISYNDIKYFLSDTSYYSDKIGFSGIISGSINNFNLQDFNVEYEDILSIQIDAKVKDLPKFEDPIFDINVGNFSINIEKIRELKIPGKDIFLSNIPEELNNIKTIQYTGNTVGKLSNFISKGEVSGNFGQISINATAKKDSFNLINVKGQLSGKNIDLAQVVKNKYIGMLTFNQEIDFSYQNNKKLKLKTQGKIDELTYNNYTYREIELYADVFDKKVDSISIYINQNDIKAKIYGNINFIPDIPEFNLTADIDKANLKNLNIDNAKENSSLSLKLDAFFNGINIDDFVGTISLTKPIYYQKDTLNINVNNLVLSSFMTKSDSINIKEITLFSDWADFTIQSTGQSSEIINSLKELINQLFKSEQIIENKEVTAYNGNIDIEGTIKKTDDLTALFFPGVKISENSKVFGYYNSQKKSLNLSLNSRSFNYNKITINDFYVIAYTKKDRLYAGTGGSSLSPNESFLIENFNMEGDLKNDSLNFNVIWNNFNDSANYSADISGIVNFKKKNDKQFYECLFSDSKLIMNNSIWNFTKSKISIDSSHINISDLTFVNGNEQIYIDGNISEYSGDILYTEFKNFNLKNLAPLIPDDLKIAGEINGSATFAQLYEDPLIFTRDSVVNLFINDIEFGNLYFNSYWDKINNRIHANAYSLKGKKLQFMNDTIYGDYWPTKDSISFIADIRNMSLNTFQQYYEEYVDFNKTAYVTGIINLNGNLKNPKLYGDLKLKQTTAYIKFLNTINNIDEMNIRIDDKKIVFSNTKLVSNNRLSSAMLKGKILHTNFSKFKLDIDIEANNYMLMDIIASDSSYFYGKAFGTGNINISGPIDDIVLNANITTEKNTNIFIPISAEESFDEESSFIKYVSKKDTDEDYDNQDQYTVDLRGFTMDVKLNVTQNAEIQITPDESTGDIITKGEGDLNLTIDKEGNFSMYGVYKIIQGKYQFSLDIIRKDFDIIDGGTIEWYGDPEDATIDIEAVYSVKNVPLEPVKLEETESRKTDIDCYIELSGKLLNPDLKLNIKIPENIDQGITAKINAWPENKINEQFLSLLLIGQFFNPESSVQGFQPDVGQILADQLNSLISNIGIGVIYETGNDSRDDKYGIQYKTTVWDDRIELKGNVGVGGSEKRTDGSENYVGEFEVEAKLNKKGTVRLKGYNKANDKIENDGDYIQGIGFVWRKKFDSFFFWKRNEEVDSVKIKSIKTDTINIEKSPLK